MTGSAAPEGDFKGRVLYVTDRYFPNNIGGAERIAQLEARAWSGGGGVAAVFSTKGEGGPARWGDESDADIVEYRSISVRPNWADAPFAIQRGLGLWRQTRFDHPVSRELERAVEDFQPDIIHAHHISRISYGAVAGIGVPKVLTFHDYHFECLRGGLVRPGKGICHSKCISCRCYTSWLASSLEKFDRIIAISRFMERRLLEHFSRDRVRFLPNGLPFPPATSGSMRQNAAGPLRITCVGRIEENKGILDFAVEFSARARVDWQLTIIGAGADLAALEALALTDGRIRLLGRLGTDHVRRHLDAGDVVVVPSKWHEVLNTVVREAQQSGCVVIATDVGGNADMITHAVDGYLVGLEGGVPDWAHVFDVLSSLDDDRCLLAAVGEAAREKAGQFDLVAHMNRLRAIYAELVDP